MSKKMTTSTISGRFVTSVKVGPRPSIAVARGQSGVTSTTKKK